MGFKTQIRYIKDLGSVGATRLKSAWFCEGGTNEPFHVSDLSITCLFEDNKLTTDGP